MAIEDIGERLEGKGWVGVAVGTVVLAPFLLPAVGRALRPAAKSALKGAFALTERARALAAETGEQFQDLVAEARAEYESEATDSEMMTMAVTTDEVTEEPGRRTEAEPKGEAGVEEEVHAAPRRRTSHVRKSNGSSAKASDASSSKVAETPAEAMAA